MLALNGTQFNDDTLKLPDVVQACSLVVFFQFSSCSVSNHLEHSIEKYNQNVFIFVGREKKQMLQYVVAFLNCEYLLAQFQCCSCAVTRSDSFFFR